MLVELQKKGANHVPTTFLRADCLEKYAKEENGNWKFIFSLPEIAEFASSVDVREVSFEMKRAPMLWYQKLFGNKAP